jgi:SnoaL-like domain
VEHTELQQQAQAFIDALHALEQDGTDALDGLVALFSADAQLTNAALILAGQERKGTDGVRKFWAEYHQALGTVMSDFHAVTVGDNTAGLFWTTRGVGAEGSDAQTYDGATLLVFDAHGKIARFHGYYDTAQLKHELRPS